MKPRSLDPWDLIAVPMFWFLMGVAAVREWVRLIWARRRTKTSLELEL